MDRSLQTVILSVVACAFLGACSATSEPGDNGAIATQTPGTTPAVDIPDVGSAQSGDETPQPATTYEPVIDDALVAAAANIGCGASAERFRDTMVAVVNDARLAARQCGTRNSPAVGVVSWNDELAAAALSHANDMVTFNFFSHDGSDGLSVANRAETAGYDWRAIGENIAAGQQEVEEVHQGWLESPGHCRNIMNTLYTEIGAACVNSEDTDFGNYWVVVFGNER
jgi:uncharacterized protein YkwD